MLVLLCIAISLLLAYGLLLQFYYKAWEKMPYFSCDSHNWRPTEKISIIIPARNEANNIAACLTAVLAQNYPSSLLEIIVVNDQSTDNTAAVVASFIPQGVILLETDRSFPTSSPKKKAIETGIKAATGTLIVTTDADCTAGYLWIQQIAKYHAQTKNVFMAAPVKMVRTPSSILSAFQAVDFLTMQGITAAAIYKKAHNMCNGANLAYEKKVFEAVDGFNQIDHIASGDDMLLMQKIASRYAQQIGFIKNQHAIVTTQTASTWKEFLQQRIRWASKARHYKEAKITAVLAGVYFLNLALLTIMLSCIFQPKAILYFILLCTGKFLIELRFVKSVANFFEQQHLLIYLLLLQPLHILYIVLSGCLGQFKHYQWKGRQLQ
jgi:cellulose synthase/poly-beta-1,6-N-acetylglucosamine synthase-like glycosyltransferase